MRASFASPKLSFTRDGRRLLAVEHDAVTITDVLHGTTTRIAVESPRAAIGFVDQIWIAHGRSVVLTRYGLSGAALDESKPLSEGSELIAAAAAAPAAVWTGYPPLAISEEQGATHVVTAPPGDVAIPLTSRRWIVAAGARVTVPSGLSCELGSASRIAAAAIVIDATAVLVLAETRDARELVVIRLGNGRPQLRRSIAATQLRVASRRGLVAAIVDSRRIGVIDLRSGRVIGELGDGEPLIDCALDPDGHRVALRRSPESVELLELHAALERARRQRVHVSQSATDVATPPHAEVSDAAADTGAGGADTAEPDCGRPARHGDDERPDEIRRPLELAALVPIEYVSPVGRAAALELLDREVRTVALWTLCAITEAWNTRRLGYGNEGKHPYEHEVAALLGMNTGFASEHVQAARAHLAAHEAACATEIDARAPMLPLGSLACELGLSALAVDMLLVIAAPALWNEAARLFGILANDPGRALVDEALVVQILSRRANRHDIAAELDPRAPLVRFGVVTADTQRAEPFSGLTVDPIVLARLRCELPDLGAGLSARGSDRALEEIAVGPGVITRVLAALARCTGHARIVARGRAGSGRRTLLAAIAAEAGRPLGIIDAQVLPRTPRERATAIRLALRRALLAGLMPCIVGLDVAAASDGEASDALADVMRGHPGPIAVVLPANETPPFDPGYIAIDLPVLAESDRVELWRTALADAGLGADAALLASRYRIGPGTIHRALSASVAVGDDRTRDATAELEGYIRQTRDTRLGAHARRVERLAAWNSIVLPADIRDSLLELVARVRHRRTVFESWGMGHHMTTSRGLTALFSGSPGTGKTLVAGAIARELGLDLYQVELSKLMSKWIGETERNLATIFDAAEDGQAILLFDEADSLFARRTEVRSSNDRYANLEVNYLLQRLDSFEGIAILTTNASSAIDPAFKRRMSFRLSFPFPDEDTRTELWRAHLPPSLPISGPLALDRLAHKYQLSGGYIRNACLRAAFLAARDEGALMQHHLERAVALEYAELGKLSAGGTLD